MRQESTFGFPDFVVAYSAGRNFAWTASPDAQKTRSMIAVSRRVDSRSWSRRTSRCSGRSPAAPAAERQGVRRTWHLVWSSELERWQLVCEGVPGQPDPGVGFWAGRNGKWAVTPDARNTRTAIAVSRRADSRSRSRRTSRCSGRSPSALAAERQIVSQTDSV